jgi:hypothetical protein
MVHQLHLSLQISRDLEQWVITSVDEVEQYAGRSSTMRAQLHNATFNATQLIQGKTSGKTTQRATFIQASPSLAPTFQIV